MLAKSWNYAFMDSRIILAKSSYYALARGDTHSLCCTYGAYSICGQHAVSFFLNSSAQHRENEAEPDSNGNKNFQSGPNVPCQSAQTDKSVSSA